MNQNTKKLLFVFGTRPEAIKLAPVIKEARKNPNFGVLVCVFRQHREMLDQVLKTFEIRPDFDFGISLSDRDLFGQGLNVFLRVKSIILSGLGFLRFLFLLKRERPDFLLVQGDTSTVFLAAFLAFHFKIRIIHVEAGLRTYDKHAPFPEEMNRQLLCRLADVHFAPTEIARKNLLSEGVPGERIFVTGNTAIDALVSVAKTQEEGHRKEEHLRYFKNRYGIDLSGSRKVVLVTAHRRESFGSGIEHICEALREIAEKRPDVLILYPVHLNPSVQSPVRAMLGEVKNIALLKPLDYDRFVFLMNRAHFILTDSGGVQEEAPTLKKPVLVMREKTERLESVQAGVSKLVGTDKDKIVKETLLLLEDKKIFDSMTVGGNPYGDGHASERIIKAIMDLKS